MRIETNLRELRRRRETVTRSRFKVSADDVMYCNWYVLGDLPPHYPVPSLYCFSLISNKVDQRACEMNITDMMLSMLKP